jgi:hypothetical protein
MRARDSNYKEGFRFFVEICDEKEMEGGNMGININWSNIGWTESDDFIHFAFGDFNSKTFSTNG